MITKDEVFDEAMKAALHIMATPHAQGVVTRLERLILDSYERGMNDMAEKLVSTQITLDLRESVQ